MNKDEFGDWIANCSKEDFDKFCEELNQSATREESALIKDLDFVYFARN